MCPRSYEMRLEYHDRAIASNRRTEAVASVKSFSVRGYKRRKRYYTKEVFLLFDFASALHDKDIKLTVRKL